MAGLIGIISMSAYSILGLAFLSVFGSNWGVQSASTLGSSFLKMNESLSGNFWISLLINPIVTILLSLLWTMTFLYLIVDYTNHIKV